MPSEDKLEEHMGIVKASIGQLKNSGLRTVTWGFKTLHFGCWGFDLREQDSARAGEKPRHRTH